MESSMGMEFNTTTNVNVTNARKIFLPQMDANIGHLVESITKFGSSVQMVFRLEKSINSGYFKTTRNQR